MTHPVMEVRIRYPFPGKSFAGRERMADPTYDGPSAIVDMDMLDANKLLPNRRRPFRRGWVSAALHAAERRFLRTLPNNGHPKLVLRRSPRIYEKR
jgi:hypothetical protein